MTEPPRYPGAPRWVKVFGVIAIVVILLLIVLKLTGHHGPARHMPSGDGGAHAASSAVARENGHDDYVDAEAIGEAQRKARRP